MKHRKTNRMLLLRSTPAVIALLALGPVSAQVSSAPTPATQPPVETIVLSPFVVSAESDRGYAASSTLAGSRFKSDLKDVAASISVFTEDFLSDIGATNLTDALKYSTSAQQDMSDRSADGAVPNGNSVQSGVTEFRVRGQPTTRARDYFDLRIEVDTYNTERIEDARGPNSVLFGFGAPGGILNINIKQARLDRSFKKATLTGASYSSHRETLDLNEVVMDGKLAVRLNALYDKSGKFQNYAFNRDRRFDLALKFQATPTLQFRAEYEHAQIKENKPRLFVLADGGVQLWQALGSQLYPTTQPTNASLGITRLGSTRRLVYVTSPTAGNYLSETGQTLVTRDTNLTIMDRSVTDPTINYGGPGQIKDTSANNFSAFLEKRIGNATFLELGFNHQDQDIERYNPSQTNIKLWGDANLNLRNSTSTITDDSPNPDAGGVFMENSSASWEKNLSSNHSDTGRVTLSTELDAGKWGNYRVAVMGEYIKRADNNVSLREAWEGSPFNATPENAANQTRRRNYITPGDWSTYFIGSPVTTGLLKGLIDPITGRTLNSTWVVRSDPDDNDQTQKTGLLTGQARYLDGRLVFGAGYRYDKLSILNRLNRRDPVTNELAVDYDNIPDAQVRDARNTTYGVMGHVTKNISVFYNRANNQGLPRAGTLIDINNLNGPLVVPPNSKGEGEDMGIALRLFDNKINIRAAYYTTNAVNLSSSYGATNIAPESVSENIMGALLAAGLVSQSEHDLHFQNQDSVLFDMSSEGYELNITANLTQNWRLQANYSSTDTKQTNFAPEVRAWMAHEIPYWQSFNQGNLEVSGGISLDEMIVLMQQGYAQQADLEFVGELGTRKHKVNVYTRYDIQWERFKGAYIGGGYRYQSRNLAGVNVSTLQGFYGKAVGYVDLMAGYKFQKSTLRGLGGYLDGLTIQLNASNLFDDDDYLITRIEPDGVSIRRAVVQTPRTWRLQAKLDF